MPMYFPTDAGVMENGVPKEIKGPFRGGGVRVIFFVIGEMAYGKKVYVAGAVPGGRYTQ